MSVYTTVEPPQLEQFLKRYELGTAISLKPIAAGITNTNYYLETTVGQFILTLYEHHSDDELEYMLGLQKHLAGLGVHCAVPVTDRRGDFFSALNQRPAAIIHKLAGAAQAAPAALHCSHIGGELARFHLFGQDYEPVRPNPRGIEWLLAVSDMLHTELDESDRQLYEGTLSDYRTFDTASLPHGAIHADLFHDNALFVGDDLNGIIDFDYACFDCLVFDIAVLLNDWCSDACGNLQSNLVSAVLEAYQLQRELTREEIDALPLMLRLGALRFWFSRLYDRVFPLSGEMTFIKNPDSFRDLLLLRGNQQKDLSNLFLPHYVG